MKPAMKTLYENSPAARTAALGATRQMIADAQFGALVAALIDCNAVPHNVMAATLKRLADGLIAKARGEMETDRLIYPAEAFDRAREIHEMAVRLGGRSGARA
jgi:hypothetical protein